MKTTPQADGPGGGGGAGRGMGRGLGEAAVFPPELAGGGLLLCLLLGGVFFLLHEAECLPDAVRGACAASFMIVGVMLGGGARAVAQRRSEGGAAGRGLAKARWIEAWAFHWRRHPLCLGGNLVFLGGCLALRWYAPILVVAVVQAVFYYGVAAGLEAVRGRK